MRSNNRNLNQLRELSIIVDAESYAEGSLLICFGKTKVLCSASVEKKVPKFIKTKKLNQGWVTAEYSMLPRSTHNRMDRDSRSGSTPARSLEIQRLIARSLRSMVDLEALAEYTITVDCDVLQADGGTRVASITGAAIALSMACKKLLAQKLIYRDPVKTLVAGISLGIVNGQVYCDLDYNEDSTAMADINLVMNEALEIVEIQGTAEQKTFSATTLMEVIAMGQAAIQTLISLQKETLAKY